MTESYASAAEAERHADEARENLAKTLGQLKENLTPRRLAYEAMAEPRRLANEAVAATRERTPDWVGRFWASARSPAGLGLVGATAASIAVTVIQKQRRRGRSQAAQSSASMAARSTLTPPAWRCRGTS